VEIRPYAAEDRDAVVSICIATGDAGDDASGVHDLPELLVSVYLLPYVELEPRHAFVAVDDLGVAGYVVAALHARSFADLLARAWWPELQERYPLDRTYRPADRALVEHVHRPPTPPDVATHHPSELHIDLDRRARGTGVGRRLIEHECAALRAAGSPGVHLGVDPRNQRAIGFYRHLGMVEHPGGDGAVFFTNDPARWDPGR